MEYVWTIHVASGWFQFVLVWGPDTVKILWKLQSGLAWQDKKYTVPNYSCLKTQACWKINPQSRFAWSRAPVLRLSRAIDFNVVWNKIEELPSSCRDIYNQRPVDWWKLVEVLRPWPQVRSKSFCLTRSCGRRHWHQWTYGDTRRKTTCLVCSRSFSPSLVLRHGLTQNPQEQRWFFEQKVCHVLMCYHRMVSIGSTCFCDRKFTEVGPALERFFMVPIDNFEPKLLGNPTMPCGALPWNHGRLTGCLPGPSGDLDLSRWDGKAVNFNLFLNMLMQNCWVWLWLWLYNCDLLLSHHFSQLELLYILFTAMFAHNCSRHHEVPHLLIGMAQAAKSHPAFSMKLFYEAFS